MRSIVFAVLAACSLIGTSARTISGIITDENNQPLEFVNVVLLCDSSFIDGKVTDAAGAFEFVNADSTANMLKMSIIGYENIAMQIPADGRCGTLHLTPSAVMLNEVVVNHNYPRTQLKDNAFVTKIENSILATAGSANDVLAHLPLVMGSNGSYTVFGSGRATIFINGRQVRDKNDVEQLSSGDIKEVQVISSPGARYGNNINAVIRIITKKPVGDGISVNASTKNKYYEWFTTDDQLGLKYRNRGLEIFGTGWFSYGKSKGTENVTQISYGPTVIKERDFQSSYTTMRDLSGKVGFSYQINENHNIGAFYQNGSVKTHLFGHNTSDITEDDKLIESTYSRKTTKSDNKPQHSANVYYEGVFGKLGVDANCDYMMSKSYNNAFIDEVNMFAPDREITTFNNSRSRLFAENAIFSYGLPHGQALVGEEYTYTHSHNEFLNPQNVISSELTDVKEKNMRVFAQFSHNFGPFRATAGLNYEHVVSDYYLNNVFIKEQSRTYDHLLPSASLSYNPGTFALNLSYRRLIMRPNYSLLSGNYIYISATQYSRGNPALKPATVHSLGLQASWKFLLLSCNYSHMSDAIIQVNEPYQGDSRITVFTAINGSTRQQWGATINASPTFGIYRPSLSLAVNQQFFGLEYLGRYKRFNHPSFTIRLDNTLTFPHGWGVFAMIFWRNKGANSMNWTYTRSLSQVDIEVNKRFLNNSLIIYLRGWDLFNGRINHTEMCNGNIWMHNDVNNYTRRTITLTVRYFFNNTRDRYKGAGAGKSEKQRL